MTNKSDVAIRKQGVIDILEKISSLAEGAEKQAKRFTESLASGPEWLPVEQQALKELKDAKASLQSAQHHLSQAWQRIHHPDKPRRISGPPHFPDLATCLGDS